MVQLVQLVYLFSYTVKQTLLPIISLFFVIKKNPKPVKPVKPGRYRLLYISVVHFCIEKWTKSEETHG